MSNKRLVQCPECKYEFQVFASRDTSNGHRGAKELIYFLNTQTIYEAFPEPKSSRHRPSGVGMRPDIKLKEMNALPGQGFIFVERQEQNTPGTGSEKVANKIHKANEALRDRKVISYWVVLGGSRTDLLKKVAKDTLGRGGAYPHERLHVVTEREFIEKAYFGAL